jgi:hypothetical protein
MSDYRPDRWTVLRIHAPGQVIYKVFASWSGGYTGSDSWKLNSGITRATLVEDSWEFDGSSGSVYSCHRDAYGTNGYGGHVLNGLLEKAEKQGIQIDVLSAETNWATLNYDPLAQWVQTGVQDA